VGALALGLDQPIGEEAGRLAGFLARSFGPSTVALLHYGSHAQDAGAGPGSAWDFFVVVDDYPRAYRALSASLPRGFPARRASLLNRVLPPNVIAVTAPEDDGGRLAKCCVLSLADLARGCSPRARDHFVRARLFQQVRLAWVRDEGARARVEAAVAGARWGSFTWVRPFLPKCFDAWTYCRRLLELSYGAEIRPEGADHLDTLLDAQRDTLLPVFERVLEGWAERGTLVAAEGGWRDPRPPGPWARARARSWFAASKVRATLRWLKYVALYDDWLEYVVGKVERRSGVRLELTERERRWPLLFLWPKALRYIAGRRGGSAR